jgi:hypothetical protein
VAREVVNISQHDVGIVLECTLTFTDFDLTGASAALYVGSGSDRGRAMSLVGTVASYTVQANDFEPGYFDAQVRVTKDDVTVASEVFTLIVNA